MSIASPAVLIGMSLNQRYQLDRLVGEGASAWVFASTDLRLERKVAVKVLKPSFAQGNASRRKRFVDEGRTLAGLVHPHIVLVHDAGETEDGIAYLVMELSETGSLETELTRRTQFAPSEALELLLPLFGAIECAHERGIIHRDIKPDNIALVFDKSGPRAKILDFGIAKRWEVDSSSDAVLGTPAYMAPEQVRGEPLTPAADVWSLGVVLFRCLTGKLPFEAETSSALLVKLVQERAPRFAFMRPDLGPHLTIALDRSLEPRVERRYADVRAFARALGIACVQDRIPISRRPEPIGLPDFELWLARADTEVTKTLEGARPGPESATWSQLAWRRPSLRPDRRSLAMLGVGAATLLLALMPRTHERSAATPDEHPTAPAAGRIVDTREAHAGVPASPTGPAVQTVLALQPSAPTTLPVLATPVRRRKPRAAAQPGTTTVPMSASQPAAPGPTRPNLIMTWDW